MIVRPSLHRKQREPAATGNSKDVRVDHPGVLSCSQWANDDGNWMITLCDLTFLLIGFLVVWYVINKQSSSSLAAAPANPPHKKAAVRSSDAPLLAPEGWELLREEMEDYVSGLALQSDVDLRSGKNEIVLSLKDTVSFDSGSADLRERSFPLLEKVAAVAIAQGKLQIEVRGHTDDRPISTPEFPSNWELSTARASRVARYLIERGVYPSRIAVQGFANQRPRVSNTNSSKRSANRRVEIRLYEVPAF